MIASPARTRHDVRQRTLFREVNERIREINEGSGLAGDSFEFLCECGVAECLERVEMSLSEYREIRQSERNFLVTAGHERPQLDRVVAACPSYRAVEILSTAGADGAAGPSSNGEKTPASGP